MSEVPRFESDEQYPPATGHERAIAALGAVGFAIERGPNDHVPEIHDPGVYQQPDVAAE